MRFNTTHIAIRQGSQNDCKPYPLSHTCKHAILFNLLTKSLFLSLPLLCSISSFSCCTLYNCVLAVFLLSVVANIDIKACRRDCVTVERNKITDKKAARYCAWTYYPVGIPRRRLIIIMREIAPSQPPLRREFFASKARQTICRERYSGKKRSGRVRSSASAGGFTFTLSRFSPRSPRIACKSAGSADISPPAARMIFSASPPIIFNRSSVFILILSQSPHCAANRVRRAATLFHSPLFNPEISSLSRARWTSFKSGAAEE